MNHFKVFLQKGFNDFQNFEKQLFLKRSFPDLDFVIMLLSLNFDRFYQHLPNYMLFFCSLFVSCVSKRLIYLMVSILSFRKIVCEFLSSFPICFLWTYDSASLTASPMCFLRKYKNILFFYLKVFLL